MRLRDLGQFAAHMQFQLVPFLKREQGRAATVLHPVKALKKLHDDFEWPHPTSSSSVSKRLIKEFPRSFSMQEQGSAAVDPIDQLNRHECYHLNYTFYVNNCFTSWSECMNLLFKYFQSESLNDSLSYKML